MKKNYLTIVVLKVFLLLFFTEGRGQQPEKPQAGNPPQVAQPSVSLPPTQMETGPEMKMEALNAKMAVDHYMHRYYENGKLHFEVYDGKEIREPFLGDRKTVYISKNQKYYATTLFPDDQGCYDCMVEVTLVDITGDTVAKGPVKWVYGFEGAVDLLPFDDGKRFIIYGQSTILPFFAIYSVQPNGQGFVQDFRYGEDSFDYHGDFILSEKQERIIVTHETYWQNKLKPDTLSLTCYNLKGKKLWESIILDIGAVWPMFISDEDGSLSLTSFKRVLRTPTQEALYQTFFDKDGRRIYEYAIEYPGDFDICHYKKMNDTLFFVFTGGGKKMKITNLETLKTTKERNWEDNLIFGNIVLHQGKVLYTRLKRGITIARGDAIDYTPPSDQQFIIDNLKDNPVTYPMKGVDFPLIMENMGNIFIGENYQDLKIDFRKNFYKISKIK